MNFVNNKKSFCIYILVLFLVIIISCDKTQKPIVGDVYLVPLKNKSFTTWKITKTDRQLIWFIINDYEVSEKSLIDSIEINENYTDSPIPIKRKDFDKKQNISKLKTQLK